MATRCHPCELDKLDKLDGNAETAGARLDFRCPQLGETSRGSVEDIRAERRTQQRSPESGQAEEQSLAARPSRLQPAGTRDQMRRVRQPRPPGDPHVQGRKSVLYPPKKVRFYLNLRDP